MHVSSDDNELREFGCGVTGFNSNLTFIGNPEIIKQQIISIIVLERYMHQQAHYTFSGFSVGFCINEEKVICYQLELGK